jgi:peptide chain release factor 3
MRNTPVMVFINKLDREGKDAFELLDDIERKLKLKVKPLSWPIGMGQGFKGVYNIYNEKLYLFSGKDKQVREEPKEIKDIYSAELDSEVGANAANKLREELELLNGVYQDFKQDEYLAGYISPVFFGSALNNFGVQELLECLIDIAPSPQPSYTFEREINPYEEKFSGFVFKIHANMDPKHRDRIAFVKICSGTFLRNTNYFHTGLGKQFKFSSPTAFMAQKKSVIDEAYPGDVIGLHDTGNFKIGDTLSEGENIHFKGIPSFSPEMFKYVENADPLKSKQLAKGVDQLMDEGVAQLFTRTINGRKIIGTVGALQFEVIEYRLLHEYGATSRYEAVDFYKACWITGDKAEIEDFKKKKYKMMATDKHGRDVFLAETSYALTMAQENFKKIEFHFSSEF